MSKPYNSDEWNSIGVVGLKLDIYSFCNWFASGKSIILYEFIDILYLLLKKSMHRNSPPYPLQLLQY